MNINIGFDLRDKVEEEHKKAKYVKEIINDYCVLDLETTGLSAEYDEIIEIGILKVRNNQIVDRFEQLIKPKYEIDDFITKLTGITNEMLSDKPSIQNIKNEVLDFIGNDTIVGHNTSFDIRFLNNSFDVNLENKYIDTMQFARKLFPELEHHRLTDLSKHLNLSNNAHRSIADCITTKDLYDKIKEEMNSKNLKIEDLFTSSSHKRIDIKSINPTSIEIDTDNFFYKKHVVFTGKLDKMLRKDAMQIIVNLGGILDLTVNKDTNYLILGNNDYNVVLNGEKSSKHKKAEQLKLKGQDIEILDENTFYSLLEL